MNSHHSRTLRKADVAALLALLFVAVAAAPSVLSRARELANRTNCAANISGISKAMIVYANDNNDDFPCTQGISGTQYTMTFGGVGTKSAEDTLPQVNAKHKGDPTTCFWMLVLDNSVSPKSFLCKSDPFQDKAPSATKDATGALFLNFEKPTQLSYSVNFPWTAGGKISPVWTATLDSGLPFLSDMAPFNEPKATPVRDPAMKNAVEVVTDDKGQFIPAPATAPGAAPATGPAVERAFTYNSPNHAFAGQNVSFGDAHCEWTRTPVIKRDNKSTDNIWTRATKDGEQTISAGDIGGALQDKGLIDTVMVPARASDGSVK
jgi:hypothetical protein